ncbi:MAG: hypothetical protein Q9216_003986 [Gyalolechia sp. 2 TL-2023]
MSNADTQSLAKRLALTLNSGKYSDLVIICRDHTFHAHRVVLCTASSFFAKACDGDFREAQTATIDLSDDDPKPLERMLKYLYTDNYDENDQSSVQTVDGTQDAEKSVDGDLIRQLALNGDMDSAIDTVVRPPLSTTWTDIDSDNEYFGDCKFPVKVSAVWNNVQVYALADKYDVQPLKALAAKRFENGVTGDWETDDILTMMTEVYNTTPITDRGLRENMLKVCSRYADELMALPAFHEVIRNDGSVAADIVRMFHDAQGTLETEIRKLKEALEDLSTENRQSRKEVQSLQDKLTSARQWATEEKRVLRNILPRGARCRACSAPLHLRMTKGDSSRRKFIRLGCDSCKVQFMDSSDQDGS